ncbi:hypothetical protein FF1_009557 [Malus domestica]
MKTCYFICYFPFLFPSYGMGPITLVSMYCRCGELQNAYKLFDGMPVRNVVSWTAIISGFAQTWKVDVCLQLLNEMRNSSESNDFTYGKYS